VSVTSSSARMWCFQAMMSREIVEDDGEVQPSPANDRSCRN
jgi:hypothetical protein